MEMTARMSSSGWQLRRKAPKGRQAGRSAGPAVFADGCIPWLLHCRVLSRWPRGRSRTVAVQDSVRSRTPRLQEPAMLISDVLRTKGHHVVRIHTVDSVELAVRKLAEHRIGALVAQKEIPSFPSHSRRPAACR